MSMLRGRLARQPETVQDLELAAESRYWEGTSLALAGESYAAIYLMGYAAEMWLKLAALRLDGVRPTDPVKSMLPAAKKWLQGQAGVMIDHEMYHSLWFWVTFLKEKRWWKGKPLDAMMEARLSQRARRLYGTWWVEMRYRPSMVLEREAQSVYDDVTWIRDHYRELWRL
ncbi:MAG TPA: hypothetical protein VHQ47_11685 [Phycisphaerae bacterium]|nr:hypothetical protein [Phycisphaerae bacterium]